MREILTGKVSEGLLCALFGLIAREELCGVLRVSQNNTINTVFFEIGVPIFAVGGELTEPPQELSGEQAGVSECSSCRSFLHRFPENGGCASEDGADGSPEDTPPTRESALEAAKQIILSMFEWKSGEYLF